MSKLPEGAQIRCEPSEDYETESVHEASQMNLFFFQVLNAFRGDKKVFCTDEFSDARLLYKTMRYFQWCFERYLGLELPRCLWT